MSSGNTFEKQSWCTRLSHSLPIQHRNEHERHFLTQKKPTADPGPTSSEKFRQQGKECFFFELYIGTRLVEETEAHVLVGLLLLLLCSGCQYPTPSNLQLGFD
jgi:hypothetical protein